MEKFSEVACMKAELQSFRAVCAVAEAVSDMRMGGETMMKKMEEIIPLASRYLEAFVDAYPSARYEKQKVRPKHHKLFHLGRQSIRDATYMDCWATERKKLQYSKSM